MNAGFGLGRLHHLYLRKDRERVVRGALDAGFRHFDLAPAYGDGLLEREVGRILRSRRAEVTLTTKYGIPFRPIGLLPMPIYFALRAAGKITSRSLGANYAKRDFSPRALVASLDASLRRLRTDYVDYLLVHEPLALDEFRGLSDVWPEMERQRTKGKLRHFGVSSLTQMLLDAEKENLVPRSAVRMVPMNDATCGVPASWFQGREVFVFNIVTHLRRTLGPGRIATSELLENFTKMLPACRPILATHNTEEIKRMGEALAATASRNTSIGEA